MIIKFLAVLLYVWLGSDGAAYIKMDQRAFDTLDQCQTEGIKRTRELSADPSFVQGLFAKCLELPVREAKS